ncbi:hypothetical protein [Shimia ponticola]|uniref:hypothetical protein n=1 Tax=Shimia ponticola TaxID=2582893 RepID=UPI0011BE9605|nr:hypothetical protein [Shimia ponticola]
MGELGYAAILCILMLGGETEVTHAYSAAYDVHRIRTDCETSDQVIEVGMDKRSSLDSLQQVLFAAEITQKSPKIVMIDTDGRFGPYETRVSTAARRAGVDFEIIPKDALIRWQMTSWLRSYDAASVALSGS